DGDRGQIVAFDLQHRHVGGWIGADDFRRRFFAALGKGDFDFFSPFDDVIGGKDVTIFGDNDSGAQTLSAASLGPPLITEPGTKKLAQKWIIEKRVNH